MRSIPATSIASIKHRNRKEMEIVNKDATQITWALAGERLRTKFNNVYMEKRLDDLQKLLEDPNIAFGRRVLRVVKSKFQL